MTAASPPEDSGTAAPERHLDRAPWRCRHGWHQWWFESMTDRRMVEDSSHSSWVCTYVKRCSGCRLRETKYDHALPLTRRELRIEYVRPAASEHTP